MKTRTAYRVLMLANAANLCRTYGDEFYRQFRQIADEKLRELIPRIPDLSDSMASLSYGFITAYVPYFHAFKRYDQTRRQAGELL